MIEPHPLDLGLRDRVRAPRGHLRVEVYRRGCLAEVMDRDNLVVIGSQQANAQLLGGLAGNAVNQIGFGVGLTPAVFGNTALTTPFTKAIGGVTFPAPNEVAFSWSLATGENNGAYIGEYGLITAAGLLYARVARTTPLLKTSAISLSSTWTITFP